MNYYVRKVIDFFTTLLLVSLVTFLTFQLLPGNPALAILGPDAQQSQIEALEAQLGTDRPLPLRYLSWLGGVFTGNLGTSYKYNKSVNYLISNAFRTTASLAFISLILTAVIGTGSGILFSAFSKKKLWSSLSTINQIWISMPSFCTALILILIFSVTLNLLPSVGFSGPASLILPSLSISLGSGAVLGRYIKTSIENELKKDYVRTARSKGLNTRQVITRHVLRNALIPSITTLGLISADIFGGSIIIENVFSLPGIGKLITNSISSRDFPLLQGLTLYLAAMTLFFNFLTDILYTAVDPRARV
jgi:peptide/nickel transport system permease protein